MMALQLPALEPGEVYAVLIDGTNVHKGVARAHAIYNHFTTIERVTACSRSGIGEAFLVATDPGELPDQTRHGWLAACRYCWPRFR